VAQSGRNVKDAEILLLLDSRYTQHKKPVWTLAPLRRTAIVIEIEVCANENYVSGVSGRMARFSQKLGLKSVKFVRQTMLIRGFAGQIIHAGQRCLGR
jgi:hypothetical protein